MLAFCIILVSGIALYALLKPPAELRGGTDAQEPAAGGGLALPDMSNAGRTPASIPAPKE